MENHIHPQVNQQPQVGDDQQLQAGQEEQPQAGDDQQPQAGQQFQPQQAPNTLVNGSGDHMHQINNIPPAPAMEQAHGQGDIGGGVEPDIPEGAVPINALNNGPANPLHQ